MRLALAGSLLVALAGCAGPRWQDPPRDDPKFQRALSALAGIDRADADLRAVGLADYRVEGVVVEWFDPPCAVLAGLPRRWIYGPCWSCWTGGPRGYKVMMIRDIETGDVWFSLPLISEAWYRR